MKYILIFLSFSLICCEKKQIEKFNPDNVLPKEIIDLSPVITTDLHSKLWGKAALDLMEFKPETEFRHAGMDSPAYVRNSYLEIFNHGGAHLDAPNHTDPLGKSIEEYDLNRLIGQVKIFDASNYKNNTSIPVESLKALNLTAKDIFILHVNYVPPQNENEFPAYPFLSVEACQYLASIPIKAIATDALSIESFNGFNEGLKARLKGNKDLIPNHYAIFEQEIPLFETLENVEALLDKENIIFIGFPLKFDNGNGSPVRAVAFIY
jgi:kynurenine formamidase